MMNNNDIVPGFDDDNDKLLQIRLERAEDVAGGLILHLSGSITSENANRTRTRLKKAIEAGYIRLIISLDAFNFVSELTVGCLVECLKAVEPRGGDVVLVDLPPSVFEAFALLGFSAFFNLRKNVRHGIALFLQTGPFPKVFRCVRCGQWFEVRQEGVIRCAKCEAVFSISGDGKVSRNDEEESPKQQRTPPAETSTRHITVILVNMIDYVSLCERTLGMTTLLNHHYFNHIHQAVVESGGTIGEMLGDRQFAYWSGHSSQENALCACTAAIRTANRIAVDSSGLSPELRFRVNIGVATGNTPFILDDRCQIAARPLGSEAARLVDLGKGVSKRVLIDHETYRQIPQRLKVQRIEAKTPTETPVYALYGVHR